MKLKSIKWLGLGLALGAGLTVAANASVVYTWVPAFSVPPSVSSSGTLTYDGTSVTSFSFTDDSLGTDNTFAGVVTIVGGDVVLLGASFGGTGPGIGWAPTVFPFLSPATLQAGTDNATFYGDWVPVPEPTTMIAGALLLLPFGASTFRFVRKNRLA